MTFHQTTSHYSGAVTSSFASATTSLSCRNARIIPGSGNLSITGDMSSSNNNVLMVSRITVRQMSLSSRGWRATSRNHDKNSSIVGVLPGRWSHLSELRSHPARMSSRASERSPRKVSQHSGELWVVVLKHFFLSCLVYKLGCKYILIFLENSAMFNSLGRVTRNNK